MASRNSPNEALDENSASFHTIASRATATTGARINGFYLLLALLWLALVSSESAPALEVVFPSSVFRCVAKARRLLFRRF